MAFQSWSTDPKSAQPQQIAYLLDNITAKAVADEDQRPVLGWFLQLVSETDPSLGGY